MDIDLKLQYLKNEKKEVKQQQNHIVKHIYRNSSSSTPQNRTDSPPQTFPPKLVLLDFGDMGNMPEATAEILDCYGCVDILILNSSMKVKAPAHSLSLEMDKLLMDNNYFGPATLAKGGADARNAQHCLQQAAKGGMTPHSCSRSAALHDF